MSTRANMVSLLETELARSDLTEMTDAINAAIYHYQRRRFWFNEATSSVTVSSGQEYYGSADAAFLASLVEIDTVRYAEGSTYYQLRTMHWSDIDELASGTTVTGTPTHWAYYGQQLRLYPIPNTSATLRLSYVKRIDPPSSDAETGNVWMLEAYAAELIRTRAKIYLMENSIRGVEELAEAARLRAREQEILAGLLRETNAKGPAGSIRASYL